MFDRLFNRTPAIRPDHLGQPGDKLISATPLTLRLRHIDVELGKLSKQRPRTGDVWARINRELDRRLDLRPAGGES